MRHVAEEGVPSLFHKRPDVVTRAAIVGQALAEARGLPETGVFHRMRPEANTRGRPVAWLQALDADSCLATVDPRHPGAGRKLQGDVRSQKVGDDQAKEVAPVVDGETQPIGGLGSDDVDAVDTWEHEAHKSQGLGVVRAHRSAHDFAVKKKFR